MNSLRIKWTNVTVTDGIMTDTWLEKPILKMHNFNTVMRKNEIGLVFDSTLPNYVLSN